MSAVGKLRDRFGGDVTGKPLKALAASGQLGYGLPPYVASTLSSAAPLYDVVYCDFDSEPVEAALRSLGVQVARSVYDMPGVANDTSVIIEYFARRTGLRS